MIENIEQAKERLKSIIDFYKLNDENNYDYSNDVLISMKLVLEEIERLNNIINELEKWLFDNKNCVPKHITDYFEKLKGEDKE